MDPRSTYKSIKLVAKGILDTANSMVFGGYVRDMILHDHCAMQFYHLPEVLSSGHNLTSPEVMAMYVDPNFHPELADRTLVPKDIDVILPETSLDELEKNVTALGYKLVAKYDATSSSQYVCSKTSKFKLTKYKFVLPYIVRQVFGVSQKQGTVCVDVVHFAEADDLTSAALDFECNSLVLDGSMQLRLHPALSTFSSILSNKSTLDRIVQDIYDKRAVQLIKSHTHWRTGHMLDKGFSVLAKSREVEYVKNVTVAKEDVCIICMDSIKTTKKTHAVKRMCCKSAVFHAKCYKKMCDSHCFSYECPLCRAPFDSTDKDVKRMLFDAPTISTE